MLKCDILLLLPEYVLHDLGRFLELGMLLLLQLDVVLPLKVVHGRRYGHHRHQMRPSPPQSPLDKEVDKNRANVEGGGRGPEEIVGQVLHYARVGHVHLFVLEVLELRLLLEHEFELEHGRCIFNKCIVHFSGIDDLVNVYLIVRLLLTPFKLV